MAMAGIKTIIVLSFILAIGFLLVILSSALFNNFLPLLVVATYCLAPIPNWLCGKASNPDDFMDSGSGNSIVELGRFITGFLVVMGIGMYLLPWSDKGAWVWRTVANVSYSTASSIGTLRHDPDRSDGDEHNRRIVDLRDDYKFYHVLPRTGGVLSNES
ncbi:Vacuolar protein sorting-associated protein 55 [Saxophila tyrrhenica]|uniref:Vacuolar protein sorting-associated protein 55 n=1 Tax=Saxophila tyrrhenica TaxID=1690608 RepID=A0AAV9NWT5_9PEZI|nr:Vacuolar protein sorting-associated protein 55 [Saxophila tyrrhenica]